VKTGTRTNNVGNEGGNKPVRAPRNDRPPYDKDRGVKFTEEEREERNNRRNREDAGNTNNREVRPDSEFGGRSSARGGSGRGGFRGDRRGGPRGGRGAPSGNGGGVFRKREFDRQSGSDKGGIKPVDKREGAGSRNWGTYKDDIEEITTGNQSTGGEESGVEDKPKDPENVEDRETSDEKENQNDAANGPTEDQPKLMTLDEWKALQQPRQKPVFNIRKPGEGEDPSQWTKMMLIKKEKEAEGEEEEDEEEEYDCPQRAGRQKQVLEIDFHFTDSRRGGNERRGGRGGRGGGGDRREAGGPPRDGPREREPGTGPREPARGRGGFKNFRGGRGGRDDRPTRQAAPKVDDVNDFPSLG